MDETLVAQGIRRAGVPSSFAPARRWPSSSSWFSRECRCIRAEEDEGTGGLFLWKGQTWMRGPRRERMCERSILDKQDEG